MSGLENIEGEYRIKVKAEANPVSVSTSRIVPLALLDKVEEQLKKMVKDGIIQEAEEPTPWGSAMVVISKRNGTVNICVQLA